ncbi:CsbD family protein [Actinomyces sp. B33]|uniref:CsbD family protein n=1 Tax=Actinomyces sp. B33 TaxID=2942131 RepID=UPI0023419068|nr:CsbD family protein [Actinomyces sp. B33]MDC4232791.1 CsbD family protein [Actinomyces sp. B33]
MTDDNGMLDKISGTAKEAAGKVTGDEKLEAEGKLQKLEGKVKDAVDDLKGGIAALGERAKDALDGDDEAR